MDEYLSDFVKKFYFIINEIESCNYFLGKVILYLLGYVGFINFEELK